MHFNGWLQDKGSAVPIWVASEQQEGVKCMTGAMTLLAEK